MNPEILNYIQQQLDRGVDVNAFRQYLLRYYPQQAVDEHLNFVISMHNRSFEQQMPQAQQQIIQPVQQIQQQAQAPVQVIRHEIHISKKTWAFAFVIVVSVAIFIFALQSFNQGKVPKQLDINIEPITKTAYVGDEVKFQLSVFNMGKSSGFDVDLKYEITPYQGGEVIIDKSESVAIQTRTELLRGMTLPQDIAPGKYKLKASVSYSQYSADSSFVFEVLSKTVPVLPPEENETNKTQPPAVPPIIPPEENVTNITQPPVPPTPPQHPVEGNPYIGKAAWELDPLLKVSKNTEESAVFCSQLSTTKDFCYYKLAVYSNNTILCDQVEDSETKDRCFIGLLMQGNYRVELCDKISADVFKQSCIALVQTYEYAEQHAGSQEQVQ